MNDKLINLIKENPDLPLVFYVYGSDLLYDFTSTVFEDCNFCRIWTVYFPDDMDRAFDDIIDVTEAYKDIFCDDDKYKDMSNEEFDKAIQDYIEKNVRHYKAIIISVG